MKNRAGSVGTIGRRVGRMVLGVVLLSSLLRSVNALFDATRTFAGETQDCYDFGEAAPRTRGHRRRVGTRVLLAIAVIAGTCGATVAFATDAWAQSGWSTPTPIDLTSPEPIDGVSCPSASFCAAVDSGGNALTYDGTSWSAPDSIDPGNGDLSSVSCPSASFCAAVDYEGNVLTYDGTSWSAPDSIDPRGNLSSVSCPSASFCAAVDYEGNVLSYNGTSWSAPDFIDPSGDGFSAVSCPSASFCAAVDGHGNVVTYNGTSWSAPDFIDPTNSNFSAVSCSSASFCAAVDDDGNVLIYDGTSWSPPDFIEPSGDGFYAVSCPSASFCAAVDYDGNVFTYDGTSWSTPRSIDDRALSSVSCPSANFCAATDFAGKALTYNGTSWSAPTFLDVGETPISSISCAPSTSFCAAVDQRGNALTTTNDGTSWGAPTAIDPGGQLNSLSCPSASFCAATDYQGNAFTYDGTSWSAPTAIDPGGQPASLSCSSASFCAASDYAGNAFTYDGTSWSAPTAVDSAGLTSLSCPSASFCAALGGGYPGGVFIYNGTSWSGPTLPGVNGLSSLSCSSASFCLAVDDEGNTFTYNGGGWSSATAVDSAGLYPLSCPSASFCARLGEGGNVFTYNGTSWSAPTAVDSAGLTSLSCSSASFCAAVDANSNVLTYTGAGLAVTTSSLPAGTVGQDYSTTLAATGGTTPYSWSQTGGTLPGGLTLATNGVISGSPTTAGTSSFTVQATDASDPAQTATANLSITVDAIPTVAVTSSPLPATPGSVSYAVTVSGQSGTPTGTVTISDGKGGTCEIPSLSAGTGSCSVTESAAEAPLTVTASYSGDSTYVPATGSITSSSSVSSGGDATAGSDGVTASATGGTQDGTDTLTETQYESDPVAPLANGSDYFDVAVSPGATFSAVNVEDCNSDVTPSTYLEWWNPSANSGAGAWEPVESPASDTTFPYGQVYDGSANPPCVSASLDANSVPSSTSQLNGTVFGLISATAPGAPTNATATAGNAAASVSFTPPLSNGGSPITGYTVTSSGGQHGSGTASPITVTGLTNGQSYTFTVVATNAVDDSAPSGASNAVTPSTVPGAPTNATATAGNAAASVSFTPPLSNGGSPITGYTVTSSGGQHGSGTASPITVTGLTNGQSYTFTVVATNAVDDSAPSGASNAVTPSTVPGAPTNATATAGNAAASVSFTPPLSNGGSPITGYTVTSSGGQHGSGTASPITVTGLTNGQSYTFTVVATNAVDDSAPSGASNAVIPHSPGFQVSTSSLPNATPGQAYAQVQLQAIGTGLGATLKWKKAGTLPKGLKLSSAGILSGTPNLRLVAGSNPSVPVQVTETVITINSGKRIKTKTTVSKTLSVHIN